MSKVIEGILKVFAASAAQVGEEKLEDVLQQLHDTKPELYEKAIAAGNILTSILLPVVDKTKTPIDNIFLEALSDAITQSAADNEVELNAVEV